MAGAIRGVALLALLLTLAACAWRPPIDVRAKGGEHGVTDWTIGVPF